MKKVLALLFISSSIFSMQLDRIKSKCLKVKTIQQKVAKHYSSKLNDIKQCIKSSPNDKKQLVESIFAPQGLGKVKLFHDSKGFHVLHNNEMSYVQPCFMDKAIRNMTPQQVSAFQKIGYFHINQMGNREFSLAFNERVCGGGPIFGAAMYWLTKVVCYGTAAAAVGTTAIATGGAVVGAATTVAANSLVTSVVLTAGTSTVGTVIGTTAGTVVGTAAAGGTIATGAGTVGLAISGASAAGATIAGVTLVEAATLTTAAGVTAVAGTGAAASVGTAAACIAGIESLSVAVGTFFGMLPTP